MPLEGECLICGCVLSQGQVRLKVVRCKKCAEHAYYVANKDKIRVTHQKWRDNNREHVRQYKREEFSRRYAATQAVSVEVLDYRELWERDEGICYLCQRPLVFEESSADHLVPIGRGGSHTKDNVRMTHRSCNFRKGARTVEEYFVAFGRP